MNYIADYLAVIHPLFIRITFEAHESVSWGRCMGPRPGSDRSYPCVRGAGHKWRCSLRGGLGSQVLVAAMGVRLA